MDTGKDAANDALRDVLSEVFEQARKIPDVPNNQHHQVITLHHAEPQRPAPWQAWVCATACLLMLVLSIVFVAMYVDLRREQQRTQDHISVIYQLTPELRAMVNDELCRQGKVNGCKPLKTEGNQ